MKTEKLFLFVFLISGIANAVTTDTPTTTAPTGNPLGSTLPQWVPRHATAMVMQIISMFCSSFVLVLFIRRKTKHIFHWHVFFLCVSDLIWTISHFINHLEAVIQDHVTNNKAACSAMAFFTHYGLGSEMGWLISLAVYTLIIVYYATQGRKWKPPKWLKITVPIVVFGGPLIWWGVIGLSLDAYRSAVYFCWPRFDIPLMPILFSDLPLLTTTFLITVIYTIVIILLVKYSRSTKNKKKISNVRSSEQLDISLYFMPGFTLM